MPQHPSEYLSDAEREALGGDDQHKDELEAIASDANEGDAVDTAADDSADDAVDDSDNDAEAEDAEPAPEFVQRYHIAPVENYVEKMAEFESRKKELRDKFQSGESDMDLAAYEEARDAIEKEADALRTQQTKADIAAELSEQNAKGVWEKTQKEFFSEPENAIYRDPITYSALNTAVRNLGNIEANANRSASWFLKEADKMVRERFGLSKEEQKVQKTPKEIKTEERKPNLAKIPKTLAELPAAELNETGDEEFADLDSLSGLELERAIAHMQKTDPAKYERYARG